MFSNSIKSKSAPGHNLTLLSVKKKLTIQNDRHRHAWYAEREESANPIYVTVVFYHALHYVFMSQRFSAHLKR